MGNARQGRHSFRFDNPPVISCWASAAGKRESEGPLRNYFDIACRDSYWGQTSWERAEQHMQQLTLRKLLQKAGITADELGMVYSGDLLNQCISSSFPLRNRGIPHLGLYGACSTMAEGLLLGSMTVAGGFSDRVAAMTSSHFAASERQYRFPLGYGGQRSPTAQWTVTGAGAVLLAGHGQGPRITGCTVGTVVDLGIKDAANMGAAMAPAALATIRTHFEDFGCCAEDFDLIVTGDLGRIGRNILEVMAEREGLFPGSLLKDCGVLIFNPEKQDVHAGGSGCGCSAAVLCGYLLDGIREGRWHRVLFCGTGALLSPVSSQQGRSIPGICHAVILEGG